MLPSSIYLSRLLGMSLKKPRPKMILSPSPSLHGHYHSPGESSLCSEPGCCLPFQGCYSPVTLDSTHISTFIRVISHNPSSTAPPQSGLSNLVLFLICIFGSRQKAPFSLMSRALMLLLLRMLFSLCPACPQTHFYKDTSSRKYAVI